MLDRVAQVKAALVDFPSIDFVYGTAHQGDYNAVGVSLHGFTITFDWLSALAEKLGTKLIDIRYSEADPGYSEYTPGSPASAELLIRWPK